MSKKQIRITKFVIKKDGLLRDPNLGWVKTQFPQLEPWRLYAVEYFTSLKGDLNKTTFRRILPLVHFFEKFIIHFDLPINPEIFLSKTTFIPNYFENICVKTQTGADYNNIVFHFVQYVLENKFSHIDKNGLLVINSNFRNPILYIDRATLQPGLFVPSTTNLDRNFTWIRKNYPQLESWRLLSVEWLDSQKAVTIQNITALNHFFIWYILKFDLPVDPKDFISAANEWPNLFQSIGNNSRGSAVKNNFIRLFIQFVLERNYSYIDKNGFKRINPDYTNPIAYISPSTLREEPRAYVPRGDDVLFSWITTRYPHLEHLEIWRTWASEWRMTRRSGIARVINAISVFIEKYLIGLNLPVDPGQFFLKTTLLPDFYQTVCKDSNGGRTNAYTIHAFFNYILEHHFSERDDSERPCVLPIYHNPINMDNVSNHIVTDETTHSPLPYGYLDALRKIIVGGLNFRDWTWAQNILGSAEGGLGKPAPDWFTVTWEEIDRNDPDCVWRLRERGKYSGGPVLEMWSPVRWVALLTKLLLPLRTFQVRMLDSGEADTLRYENGEFIQNSGRLASGTSRRPYQQGVFRPLNLKNEFPNITFEALDRFLEPLPAKPQEKLNVQLYINTNKTADIGKAGKDKGFTTPWPIEHEPIWSDIHYWLEKLRNWQEKYNPLPRQASWHELRSRHGVTKSEIQLAAYPKSCFLFRMREGKPAERHLVGSIDILDIAWVRLLEYFQNNLADHGHTHADGSPILLVQPSPSTADYKTPFTLHCLRVSMITALALEGRVPYAVLKRAVGHSRIIMTLYYIKIGPIQMAQALKDGRVRLEASKEAGITTFLMNTEMERLVNEAICNSPANLRCAIPVNPADRNPAGWMDMGHGVCLCGGNVTEQEGSRNVGGCFNGGPRVGSESQKKNGPVRGGPRNCVSCRWFVTAPWYLLALQRWFNNLGYHADEALKDAVQKEAAFLRLFNEQQDAEDAGCPYDKKNELLQAERQRETSLTRVEDLEFSKADCIRLIMRCMDRLNSPREEGGNTLVSAGTIEDVRICFTETDSELLQLSGVCEDLEIDADLRAGKAIVRRSQILDAAFANEGKPPLFLRYNEQEQLSIGNEYMRRAAVVMNPSDPEIGKRQVVSLIEAGECLSERLGVDLLEFMKDLSVPTKANQLKVNGSKNVLHHHRSS